jgi:hypothetical protein
MTTRRIWLSALAIALAIGFSPLPEVQAAPFASPGGQQGAKSFVYTAKAKKAGKKRAKKKAKKSRSAASKGSSCGTYMYRSKGKCVDARNKK